MMKNNIVKNMFVGAFCFSILTAGVCILKKTKNNSKDVKINNDDVSEKNNTEMPVRKYIKIKEFYK